MQVQFLGSILQRELFQRQLSDFEKKSIIDLSPKNDQRFQ